MTPEQIRAIAEKAAEKWIADGVAMDRLFPPIAWRVTLAEHIAAAISEAIRDEWGQWEQAVGFAVTGMTREQVVQALRDAARAEGARDGIEQAAQAIRMRRAAMKSDVNFVTALQYEEAVLALSAAPAQPEINSKSRLKRIAIMQGKPMDTYLVEPAPAEAEHTAKAGTEEDLTGHPI